MINILASSTKRPLLRSPNPPLFLLLIVFLDILSGGIVMPVLPRIMLELPDTHGESGGALYGLTVSSWQVIQLISIPIVCAVSDRVGRRPVLLISALGLAIDYFLTAQAKSFEGIFFGRLISGVTASTIPVAFAFVADVTPPDRRAAAFGAFGGAFGLGLIIGPTIGGFLGEYGLRVPFWVAGGVALVVAVYGYVVLPESLPADQRAVLSWKRVNPLSGIAMLRKNRRILSLSAVLFGQMTALWWMQSIFVLFCKTRLAWTGTQIGIAMGANGLLFVVAQAILTKPIVERMGQRIALIISCVSGAVGLFVMAFAHSGAIMMLGVCLHIFYHIGPSVCQAAMTEEASASDQGVMQGALNSLRGSAGIIAPLMATQLFESVPVGWFGLPFAVAGVGLMGLVPVVWFSQIESQRPKA